MPKTEQKNEKTLQFGVRKLVKQNYSQILSIPKIALSHMNIEFTKPESIYFRVELVLFMEMYSIDLDIVPRHRGSITVLLSCDADGFCSVNPWETVYLGKRFPNIVK